MKQLFSFTFLLFYFSAFTQNISVELLRKEYYKLNTDSVLCKKLFNKIKNENSTNNTIVAYKGAIYASMSNHTKNKSDKLKLFNEGKKMLEQAISKDSANLELRFLRFTIQTNCPKALGYHKNINNDKIFIINNFNTLKPSEHKNKIIEFLSTSAYLNEQEKKKIKQ